VEFAAGLPLGMKIRDGVSKWPLRELLARYVPRSVFERPKSGFGVPIEDWIRGPLRPWAEAHLLGDATRAFLDVDLVRRPWEAHLLGDATRAFLDVDLVRRTWEAHLRGRANHAYELWDVLMFSVWAEHRGLR